MVALPFVLVLAVATATSAAAPSGGYTAGQAAQGASVFAANCSACHARNLTGATGPSLVGTAFKKSIDANYKTAGQLEDFISKQMPLNAPASLSEQNYLAVTAFLLSKNGYAPGSTSLTTASAGSVKLANVMTNENGTPAASSGQADEIVRAAPPTTVEFGPLPAGANVTITDEMLGAADSDAKNWLLGGQNY
jgi:mono/diheme cytochrome c family protein